MTIKKITILTLTLICSLTGWAQKEINNWTFGQYVGLTWNTTRSVAMTGEGGTPNTTLDGLPTYFKSSIMTTEGCFTLSDADGNLLFYSDGMNIWNKNHAIMTNGSGLAGDKSSAQSGIMLPYPEDPKRYVAVSAGNTYANNLSYSVINMDTPDGLGEVDLGRKNVMFQNAQGLTGESVTAVLHANGTDYWVVGIGWGKGYTQAHLNAWLFTKDGLSTTPVVTTFAAVDLNNWGSGSLGYLKLTPDGEHFAWATFSNNSFFAGDFNASTGEFTNIKGTDYVNGVRLDYPYGVEFSTDQSLLYLSDRKGLYVYKTADLYSGALSISTPPKSIAITNSNATGLQLAPDKRIYWTTFDGYYTSLRIIDNVDDFNNIKLYRTPNNFLNSPAACGLPSFSASWFVVKVPHVTACAGYDAQYDLSVSMKGAPSGYPVKLIWNFGDGTPQVEQGLTAGVENYTKHHTFASAGQYTVKVTPYRSNGTAFKTIEFKTTINDCVMRINPNVRLNLK